MNSLVAIHPQVLQALHDKQPVVALESAIISHGMSYPKNVETALCVEDVIRKHGVVPATVAIMNGKCQVGITPEQIEYLGNASGVWKVSLRDMPYVVSKRFVGWNHCFRHYAYFILGRYKSFCNGRNWWGASWGSYNDGYFR
jgi:pseudouridine-5'-phosphate glycosidase